jgi:hypothetical protein
LVSKYVHRHRLAPGNILPFNAGLSNRKRRPALAFSIDAGARAAACESAKQMALSFASAAAAASTANALFDAAFQQKFEKYFEYK